MAPLFVLIASFLLLGLSGALGVEYFAHWEQGLRWSLAVMFLFTAVAHFTRTRADLIRMVPPSLSHPGLLVTITGVLEFAGAIGLMIPALAAPSALALILLLIAMFPANIRAARARLPVAGRTAMPWPARLALQLFWIAALWAVVTTPLVP